MTRAAENCPSFWHRRSLNLEPRLFTEELDTASGVLGAGGG